MLKFLEPRSIISFIMPIREDQKTKLVQEMEKRVLPYDRWHCQITWDAKIFSQNDLFFMLCGDCNFSNFTIPKFLGKY